MEGERGEALEQRYSPDREPPGKLVAWLVVLGFFMPVNLAVVCVLAGALGAFGSLANLQTDDEDRGSSDSSSPYVSAMLRGFFVYLFLISGLLLLDANPFSDTSPGQYVRLAGFLSLMSFVVNYRPHMFGQLVAWSFQRIQARVQEEDRAADASVQRARTSTEVVTVQTEVETQVTADESRTSYGASTVAAAVAVADRPAQVPKTPVEPLASEARATTLPSIGGDGAAPVTDRSAETAVQNGRSDETTDAASVSVETVATQSTVISETQTTTRAIVVEAVVDEQKSVEEAGK